MLRLAWRQLQLDFGRSTLTCLSVAAVLAVILIFEGFQEGLQVQLRRVVLDRGADLVATQSGVSNMIAARSVIPQMARGQIESVEGVRIAHPMTALPFIYEQGGRKTAMFLFVVDSAGGPEETLSGRLPQFDGEILIDRSISERYGLLEGDELVVAGYPFAVSGVTEAASALWTPFVFTNYDSLIEFYFESDLADDLSAFPLVSNLLIVLEPDADPETVAAGIEDAVPDVDVFPPEVIARNDEELGKTMLGALLSLLIGVSYLVGMTVVALFMFTSAEGRRRDLGVLKALGFGDRAVTASIVLEVALLTVAAVPIGIAVAWVIAQGVHSAMPIYLVLPFGDGSLIRSVSALGVFALMGSLVPLRFIRRLDPADVFRP